MSIQKRAGLRRTCFLRTYKNGNIGIIAKFVFQIYSDRAGLDIHPFMIYLSKILHLKTFSIIFSSFFYSFGKGKDCKFGPTVKKDGAIDDEADVKCLCAAGKWECTHEEASKRMADAMKKHIKLLQKITPKADLDKLKEKSKGSKTEEELKGMKKKLTKKLKEKEKGLKENSKETKKVKKLKGLVKKQLKKEKAKKKGGRR